MIDILNDLKDYCKDCPNMTLVNSDIFERGRSVHTCKYKRICEHCVNKAIIHHNKQQAKLFLNSKYGLYADTDSIYCTYNGNKYYDVPADEMTLEQARQAVKDLRKKLSEYIEHKKESKNNE